MLAAHFAESRAVDRSNLDRILALPSSKGMAPLVLVAEDDRGTVRGGILAYRFVKPDFMFLDFLATPPGRGGGGVGGALYQRLREISAGIGGIGLFFECLPADPAHCKAAPEFLADNAKRLQFYSRFGAYPIANTAYEEPLTENDTCPPHLMFDPCNRTAPLSRDEARAAVGAILERKYAYLCPPEYNARIVASITDDPVRFAVPTPRPRKPASISSRKLTVIANDRHDIFHVRERGYVEAPVRISTILEALQSSLPIEQRAPKHFADWHISAVHDRALIEFIRRCSAEMPPGKSTYPYVFPIRNRHRPPKDLALHAGYYCIDTFTPINANCWAAARRAADCALTAAEICLEERTCAYALVRPPGHHAEARAFGGFCYLNNAAIAANYLSQFGKVAVLDVDYHHGNGTQDIFWNRADVLTVSIHGHPSFAYPFFSGFAEETGEGEGAGFNINLPLREAAAIEEFFRALATALKRIQGFAPRYLVVALGLDTAAADPTGTWKLRAADFTEMGRAVARAGLALMVVQEGGYRTRTLGRNAAAFFRGILE